MAKTFTKKPETADVKDIGLQLGKVPPQALNLEEAVLGAMMLEESVFIDLQNILKEEAFYTEAHKKIYKAMSALALEQKPIDLLTVTEKLKADGTLADVGGEEYLVHLTQVVASGAHAEYHAKIVAQRYIQRELIRISSDIQRKAFDETLDVSDLLEEAENGIFKLSEGNIRKEPQRADTIVDNAMEEIAKARQNKDGLSGIPSGFISIDRITNGWQRSDLIIAAARPSMGKTAFVLSMARNITIEHKIPVAFFSLEMDSIQLIKRLIVSESKIPADKIRGGDLSDNDWKHLESSTKELSMAPLFIDDTPALSIAEFRSKARKLYQKEKVQLIIIDYLQLMTGPPELKKMREQEVAAISRSLKAVAKELNVPIIALSQLNRSTEVGGQKRPQLSNLRESGAIEQDADIVFFIHRPEKAGFKEEDGRSTEGIAEILIEKHRNGATGMVEMRFIKEEARFCEPEDYDINPFEDATKIVKKQSKMNDLAPKPFEENGIQVNSNFDDMTNEDGI